MPHRGSGDPGRARAASLRLSTGVGCKVRALVGVERSPAFRGALGRSPTVVRGMANVGPLELGVVLLVALIVFGPKRLPELGQSLGRGIREFKNSLTDESDAGDHADEPAAL